MSNKWKYATMSADERIGRVRKGDKDVYDNEMERSLDVIKRNTAEGLDISAQKEWIDNLSYNYNLYNAERMGIPEEKVNKKGYYPPVIAEGCIACGTCAKVCPDTAISVYKD